MVQWLLYHLASLTSSAQPFRLNVSPRAAFHASLWLYNAPKVSLRRRRYRDVFYAEQTQTTTDELELLRE